LKEDIILLAHGSGGVLMHRLIEEKIKPLVGKELLATLDDSAELDINGARIAFTTDSYVVKPIFFKGGDIGRLAVSGTVNDLSMKGAIPIAISLALIIEEGLPVADLETILDSIARTAEEAGIEVATGDTKVVERGGADRIFINTAGIGIIPKERNLSGKNAKPGDAVIISGTIGDHGIAVLSGREGLGLDIPVESDVRPLNHIVEHLFSNVPAEAVHVLRDPTRGGLATTLNEIAKQSGVVIRIEEELVPVKEEVRGACEILGFDPLYVACEGKFVAIVDGNYAEKALEALREHSDGKDASIIGTVESVETKPAVFVKTPLGTSRFLSMLSGEQLPRIC
jgi:hydrogenase expression/formation protein HypE